MIRQAALNDNAPDNFLRRREVLDIVGVGSSTLHRWIAAGTFPAPRKLSGTTSRWLSSEVKDWQTALPATTQSVDGGMIPPSPKNPY